MTRTRRQWVTLGLGAVLLAALCVTAAFWQWHRYTDREAQIALVEANYAADPVPLDDVLDGPGDVLADDDVWRPAVVVGEYLPQDTVLLRNRPVNGTPGFHLLVPLRTQLDGQDVVLVVDRGFVPLGADASEPAEVPDPPAGEVAVTVTLRADEPASDRDANQSSVNAVNTAQVLAAGATAPPSAPGRPSGRTASSAARTRPPPPRSSPHPRRTPTPAPTSATRSSGRSSPSARSPGTSCCGAARRAPRPSPRDSFSPATTRPAARARRAPGDARSTRTSRTPSSTPRTARGPEGRPHPALTRADQR